MWYATHWLDAVCLRWQEHATLTYSYTQTGQLRSSRAALNFLKGTGTPHSDVCPPTRCKAIQAGLESLDFKEFLGCWVFRCGSVAEWLACWTQAQEGLGSGRSRDDVG